MASIICNFNQLGTKENAFPIPSPCSQVLSNDVAIPKIKVCCCLWDRILLCNPGSSDLEFMVLLSSLLSVRVINLCHHAWGYGTLCLQPSVLVEQLVSSFLWLAFLYLTVSLSHRSCHSWLGRSVAWDCLVCCTSVPLVFLFCFVFWIVCLETYERQEGFWGFHCYLAQRTVVEMGAYK